MTEASERIVEFRPRRFRRYPDYKDSGVEWLDEIPAHWGVKPVKAALVRNNSGVWGDDFDDDGTIVLRSTEQTVEGHWRIREPARRRLSAREAAAAKLSVGDLVVTKSSGSAHHIGKTSVVDARIAGLNCCYSNFMQCLRVSDEHVPQFFWYFMNCPVARGQLVFLSSTTTGLGNLNGSILGAIRLPTAPRDEQRAIADFLNRETAKIDALVTKKERLIELLHEKRIALITRAVTQGLDPHAPMKDSGVEWLGEIPAHWNVVALRLACHSIETGGTPSVHSVNDQETGHVDWFTPGDFGDNLVLRASGRKLNHEAISLGEVKLFPAGSVFVVGIGATLGKVGLIEEPASCNQQVNILIPRPHVDSVFLANVLLGLGDVLKMMANSATLPILNQQQIGAIHIPIPPTREQRKIASAITTEIHRIGLIRSTARRTIDLLTEYRAALISAAITGKIDVRNEAA